MKQIVGSILLIIGNIWVAVSTCGMMISGAFLWLGIFIWLITSWGGILWGILWLFIGGGLTAFTVSILSLPTRLFGAGLMVIGERLKSPGPEVFDFNGVDDCMACGQARVYEYDQFCRACGQAYE